jgi:hypothetical protein
MFYGANPNVIGMKIGSPLNERNDQQTIARRRPDRSGSA